MLTNGKIMIQDELKKVDESYLINCHYGEEDSIIYSIPKFLEKRCEFPDEDRIEGSHDCIHDDGVPVDFEYKGEDANGLVINLLKNLAMIWWNSMIPMKKENLESMTLLT